MKKKKIGELDPTATTSGEKPEVSDDGLKVKDLAPGENFAFDGRIFKLARCEGEVAHVILMETVRVQKAPGRFVNQEQGKARFDMRGDILVKRR